MQARLEMAPTAASLPAGLAVCRAEVVGWRVDAGRGAGHFPSECVRPALPNLPPTPLSCTRPTAAGRRECQRQRGAALTLIISTSSGTAPAVTICPPWSTSLLQERLERARAASWRQPSLLLGCRRARARPMLVGGCGHQPSCGAASGLCTVRQLTGRQLSGGKGACKHAQHAGLP